MVEEIEKLGKQIHQKAEEFEEICKSGSGFEAHFIIGQLDAMIPKLKEMAKRCHDMNKPANEIVQRVRGLD